MFLFPSIPTMFRETGILWWGFVLLVFVWRGACVSYRVQKRLHKLGETWAWATPILQWYSLLLIGCACMICGSSWGILYSCSFTPDEIRSNLRHIFNFTQSDQTFEAFEQRLCIFTWLKWVNHFHIVACIFTLLISVFHVEHFVRRGHDVALSVTVLDGDIPEHAERVPAAKVPWMPSSRENMVLIVIALPILYSVLALRAAAVIWRLVTGQVWYNDPHLVAHHGSWENAEASLIGMCRGDLDLAGAAQYYSVFSFIRLCGSLLSGKLNVLACALLDSEDRRMLHVHRDFQIEEFKLSLNWAAFLAVIAFVVAGFMKSLLDFTLAEAEANQGMRGIAHVIDKSVLADLGAVVMVLTVLGVINMLLVGKMHAITEKLGNANLKFMGTRVLLIIAQLQSVLVNMLTRGSAGFELFTRQLEIISEHWPNSPLVDLLRTFSLSQPQALLLHVSLLGSECLIVVIMNYLAWHLSAEQEKALFIFGVGLGEELLMPDLQRLQVQARRLSRAISFSRMQES